MARIVYSDFDLLIQRAAEGYRAQVLTSPAGQAATSFTLPFSELELENFLLRVGRPRRGTRRIDSPEVGAAKSFGERLFSAVFNGEVRGCLRSSLDDVARNNAGLRIRLRLTEVPELADLPWEYLYNPSLNRFLALSVETPFVRYLELPESIRPVSVTPPLRVLVMISSPTDYPQLDVEREWRKLQESIADLTKSGMIILERLDTATLSLLQRHLRRGEYHVFHFIGHGGFEPKLQDGVLIFEDEAQRGRAVSGQDLGTLLHDHRALRLGILNACEGARTSRTDPFAGTAQSLVQQGLPAVIAMQFEITDEAAITFAHEFYAAVADGYPVDAAVAEARKAIFAEGNGLEWGTPVLYLRAADGLIFNVERPAEPAHIIEQPANLTKPAEKTIIPDEPVQRHDATEKPLHSTETPPKRKGGLPTWSMMGTGAVLLLVIAMGIQWMLDRFGRETQKPISIVSLTVEPEKKDIKVKDRVALKVKAVYSDGNAKHITEGVEWKSSNAAIASVNSAGELQAKKEGTTKVTARYGAIESSPLELSFLVEEVPQSGSPQIVSLAVDASRQELKTDERLALKARALYSDGGEKFVTKGVAWQSSQPNVAVVSSTGQVVGRSAGRSDITARYEGVLSSPLHLVVKSAEGDKPALPAVRLVSLTVESKAQEIRLYERMRLGVRGKYSDGTEKLIAGGVEWRSNQPGVLNVSADGQAEGRSEGRAEVTANYGGLSSSPLALVVKGTVEKQGPDVQLKNKMITEYLVSARAYRERGDYTEALTVLERARASDPENKEVAAAIETTRRACNAERRLGREELKC